MDSELMKNDAEYNKTIKQLNATLEHVAHFRLYNESLNRRKGVEDKRDSLKSQLISLREETKVLSKKIISLNTRIEELNEEIGQGVKRLNATDEDRYSLLSQKSTLEAELGNVEAAHSETTKNLNIVVSRKSQLERTEPDSAKLLFYKKLGIEIKLKGNTIKVAARKPDFSDFEVMCFEKDNLSAAKKKLWDYLMR